MRYLLDKLKWKDVKLHLRNKNLVFYYDKSNLIQRIIIRLSEGALKYYILKGRGELIVAEQIIENLLVFKNLREKDKTILDFGGFESVLPLQLMALGYRVTVLDQRKYPFLHPNLTVLCADIFDEKFKIVEKFDIVISISTIEHLGLGYYGDSVVKDGDMEAVKIIWNLVKEGGRLLASVPAGKPVITKKYRVYNEERIRTIFPNITSIYYFAKDGRDGVWQQVNANGIENLTYSEPYSPMPCEAIAFVICDKE